MARNRAVLEKTMAVAIATVPLEQPNIQDMFLKFLVTDEFEKTQKENSQENQTEKENLG